MPNRPSTIRIGEIRSYSIMGGQTIVVPPVAKAIAEKKTGDVELTVIRDRNRQSIRVMPEEAKGGFRTFDLPDGAVVAPGSRSLIAPQAPVATDRTLLSEAARSCNPRATYQETEAP